MDEAGEKLKRAFTGAFALLFAVIVLCAVFCNQNVFGTQSPRSLLAGCCFSKRMRKLFRKNEKSVLQFCNKSSKTKRAFTKVLMPCKRPF